MSDGNDVASSDDIKMYYFLYRCHQHYQDTNSDTQLIIPSNATHITIGPSVKVTDWIFTQLGKFSFGRLGHIKSPPSIQPCAFQHCHNLVHIELQEGLQQVDFEAFVGCKLSNIKLPSSIKCVDWCAFRTSKHLISLEMMASNNKEMKRIEPYAFQNCQSLRNLAIPSKVSISTAAEADSNSRVVSNCFMGCHDLLMIFGTQDKIEGALRSRFVGFPLHELCYCQSYYSKAELLEKGTILVVNNARSSNNKAMDDCNQDCLEMTPLHILACATKHYLALYKIIIDHQPESLITEDRWEFIPILYAIWVNAPRHVVQYLIDSHKEQHSSIPDYGLNWDKMISALCRAGASIDAFKRLLDIHQKYFSEQEVDWQNAAREFTMLCLVRSEPCFHDMCLHWRSFFRSSHVNEEFGQRLSEMMLYPDEHNVPDWKRLCEELVQPMDDVNAWWKPSSESASLKSFAFLTRCNIPMRLSMIGVRKWRLDIQSLLQDECWKLSSNFDLICDKMVSYEQEYKCLTEVSLLLELAIWKSKVDKSTTSAGNCELNAESKYQCRINCGASAIIPSVLAFLIG